MISIHLHLPFYHFLKKMSSWPCIQQLVFSHFIIFSIVFCIYSINMGNIMMNIIDIIFYIWVNDFHSLTFATLSCFEKKLPLWLCIPLLVVSHLILFSIVFCTCSLNMPNITMSIIQIALYIWINYFHSLEFAILSGFKKKVILTLHTLAVGCQSIHNF